MPNYNISVVVDPAGAESGVQVVESRMDRMRQRAETVKASLQRAFDFNTAPAVAGVGIVDRAVERIKSTATSVGDFFKRIFDRIRSTATTTGSAVDQQVTKTAGVVEQANQRVTRSDAQVRASRLQLGQQFNDFSTQVLSGGSVLTAFAQQSGQAAFALQGMNGSLGRVGSFLAGPWGTLLIIGATVLGGFIAKLWEANKGMDDRVQKLKDDEKETELDRRAQSVFANTLEGVTEALRKNKDALKELADQNKSSAEQALKSAIMAKLRLDGIRTETAALIDQAKAQIEVNNARAIGPETKSGRVDPNLAAADAARSRLAVLEGNLSTTDARIAEANRQIEEAQSHVMVEVGGEDKVTRIKKHYDGLIEAARKRALAEHTVTTELVAQVKALSDARDAAVKAQQEKDRQHSDGVDRFRTREQAIGIAGRELQRDGLHVGENEQFGGVTAHHTMASHGKFAIDVNAPGGVTEANDPGLRDRFDELARRYQARGYRVLWNGRIYEAGGDGPGPLIPAHNARGQAISQHRDHLHLEAPASIVGRATQSSTESQAIQEWRQRQEQEKAARKLADEKSDFVGRIVDAAAVRGQGGRVQTVDAQVEKVLADYKRRFNEVMAPEAQAKVRTALTDAEARETAQHFKEAYVDPLDRLRALQGTTGLARDILNRKLEETTRLGRELSPVEQQQIEDSVRMGDALQRQASILDEIRKPQEDYAARIAALNELLRQGLINQTSYNAQVADLGKTARDAVGNVPGRDPNSGRSFSEIAAVGDEDARYAKELETFQSNKAQILQLGISYDALVEAAHRRHVENLNNIDRARREVAISAAQQTADSLLSIAEMSVGKQSAVYKALFVVSKAFAIADSIIKIQQGIANAISLPFPENLAAVATVAAAAASIISNIQAVALNLADGGFVSGPGSSRSDSIPANLSNGEFVVNAQATRSNRALLEAINSGRRPQSSNDNLALAPVGGDSLVINVGDVIVQGGAGDGRQVGQNVKQAILGIVRDEIKTQKRDGGALTKGSQSVMSGG